MVDDKYYASSDTCGHYSQLLNSTNGRRVTARDLIYLFFNINPRAEVVSSLRDFIKMVPVVEASARTFCQQLLFWTREKF